MASRHITLSDRGKITDEAQGTNRLDVSTLGEKFLNIRPLGWGNTLAGFYRGRLKRSDNFWERQ